MEIWPIGAHAVGSLFLDPPLSHKDHASISLAYDVIPQQSIGTNNQSKWSRWMDKKSFTKYNKLIDKTDLK